jgi:uncharacterized protein (TIGR04255 family)
MNQLLPEFENPPVVEVAVSVQFNQPVLDTPLLMLRWIQVRDFFPNYEQAPPLRPSIETFEGPQKPRPQFEVQISELPPTPRLLMINESETDVLQIQEDRFGYSWRKLSSDHEYPRYISIMEKFRRELDAFKSFLADEGQEALSPIQCEVTYVNVIVPEEGVWANHSELDRIIPSTAPRLSEGFLPAAEQTRFATQYVVFGGEKNPLGRLYVSVEPSYLLADEKPMYLMKLTFRGEPRGLEASGIVESLDLGHEWIVRGFTTLTSREMHDVWRRMQ